MPTLLVGADVSRTDVSLGGRANSRNYVVRIEPVGIDVKVSMPSLSAIRREYNNTLQHFIPRNISLEGVTVQVGANSAQIIPLIDVGRSLTSPRGVFYASYLELNSNPFDLFALRVINSLLRWGAQAEFTGVFTIPATRQESLTTTPVCLTLGLISDTALPPSERVNIRDYTVSGPHGESAIVRMPSRGSIVSRISNVIEQTVFISGVTVSVSSRIITLPVIKVGKSWLSHQNYVRFEAHSSANNVENAALTLVKHVINRHRSDIAISEFPSILVEQSAPSLIIAPITPHVPYTLSSLNWTTNIRGFRSVYEDIRDNNVTSVPNTTTILGEFHRHGMLNSMGRSFGLEIEVDFPASDSWGFEKRTLASRLFQAGLSLSDRVHGWHYAARVSNGRNVHAGYTSDRNRWTVEFDRSVDDCDGERGCEVVSPILYDTPQTWVDIKMVLDIIRELGGEITSRHGLHVNIGAGDFAGNARASMSLINSARHFDDLLIRLGHNPEIGRWHRGRAWCASASIPASVVLGVIAHHPETVLDNIRSYNGHRSIISFSHVPIRSSDNSPHARLEFRFFDGTLDIGHVQTYVTMCLAMTAAALRESDWRRFSGSESIGGSHLRSRGSNRRQLTGEEWVHDTELFREFIDYLMVNEEFARSLVICYQTSRWQRA